MSHIEYRTYQTGDEEGILALYNRVFPTSMSPAQWRWTYRDNTRKRTDVVVAMDGTRIVGHCAAVPLLARHDGTEILTSRIQNVLVDPDYRGRGIFLQALSELEALLRSRASEFVLTYPNDNSLPAFMKLGYRHVGDIRQYVGGAGLVTPRSMHVEETAPVFTSEDATLMATVLVDYAIRNDRSADYLTWRYGEHSGHAYHVIRVRDGSALAGLAVVKPYPAGRTVDVLEFCAADTPGAVATLAAALSSRAATGMNAVALWLLPHYVGFRTFADIGFVPTERAAHVVQMPLSARASSRRDDLEGYYLTMGDSDVF